MDFSYYTKIGDIDMVRQMIDNVDVNQRGNYGIPLIEASRNGYLEIVKLLIQYGADINLTDNLGRIALHHASMYWHREIIKYLVEQGANINSLDNYKYSPLYVVVFYGPLEIISMDVKIHYIKLLLDLGADPYIIYNKEEIIKQLRQHNRDPIDEQTIIDLFESYEVPIKEPCEL